MNRNIKSKKALVISGFIILALIFIDQITKYFAVTRLKGQESFSVIDGVFELCYLENQSAAFSIDPISILHKIFHFSYFDANPDAFLKCKMLFFVILTIIVVLFVAFIYRKVPGNRRFLPLNMILIGFISGAIGNLIDRIINNYVVDFFYFRLINFPVFNVADIYVTLAAAGLILAIFFYNEEDYELIFPPKSKKKEQKS